jgi:hypothetical protein
MDIHISRNGGDGQNLNLGRAQRHDQRHSIIGSCIGINQKWKFHATQDNKLSRETWHKNSRDLSKLAASAVIAALVLGLSDHAGSTARSSLWRAAVWPSPNEERVGALVLLFSKLNSSGWTSTIQTHGPEPRTSLLNHVLARRGSRQVANGY